MTIHDSVGGRERHSPPIRTKFIISKTEADLYVEVWTLSIGRVQPMGSALKVDGASVQYGLLLRGELRQDTETGVSAAPKFESWRKPENQICHEYFTFDRFSKEKRNNQFY